MSYKLFLDDDRNPIDCVHWMHKRIGPGNFIYLEDDWVIVRNYDEFCKVIKTAGLPSFISFDHDLGKDMVAYMIDNGMSKRQARRQKKFQKSGYDCAQFLVNECIRQQTPLPRFAVHSLNPVGAENIRIFLLNAARELSKDQT